MIIGIGIDAVDIERFAGWHTYCHKRLTRFFSKEELSYCLSVKAKSAERFAARFAAKEAFYKAWRMAAPFERRGFLTLANKIALVSPAGQPVCLEVDWNVFRRAAPELAPQELRVLASLAHAKTIACASVIIEKSETSCQNI